MAFRFRASVWSICISWQFSFKFWCICKSRLHKFMSSIWIICVSKPLWFRFSDRFVCLGYLGSHSLFEVSVSQSFRFTYSVWCILTIWIQVCPNHLDSSYFLYVSLRTSHLDSSLLFKVFVCPSHLDSYILFEVSVCLSHLDLYIWLNVIFSESLYLYRCSVYFKQNLFSTLICVLKKT